eukprot:augustus_masked-scaffold_24-processed-gene-2.23-mRNA-1 protein AED:0.11 eAED:0.11 QI:0/-1/0/1/-1/1/1/0/650
MGQTSTHFETSETDQENFKSLFSTYNFTKSELNYLKASFRELAARSPGPTIDKKTFLTHFKLPGLHGEKLFDTFDFKSTGKVDFLEFTTGLALCLKGTLKEKVDFLFKIYDISNDQKVSKQELYTMLSHVPIYNLSKLTLKKSPTEGDNIIQRLVEDVFEKFDFDDNGSLSQEEFFQWASATPEVVNFLDEVFSFITQKKNLSSSDSTSTRESKRIWKILGETKMKLRSLSRTRSYSDTSEGSNVGIIRNTSSNLEKTSERKIEKEGILTKIGKKTSLPVKRHYLLSDQVMCYFLHKHKKKPKGVIMLPGSLIKPLENANYGYGFEIKSPIYAEKITYLTRTFYASSKEERDEWFSLLSQSSETKDFFTHYDKREKIGAGKFATVYLANRKGFPNEKYALKLIEKVKMGHEESKLLRTEVAILRIVDHPNVVKLVDVCEDETNLYILTEFVSGGELFGFIVGRNRFTNLEAFYFLKQVINAVEYLHSVGIMHRDLKPENILLAYSSDEKTLNQDIEIKLTDFGLSQLVYPDQVLDLPCGTISYVAPQVLSQEGYDVTADLWSIGVIMFLVLRGKLPFDAENSEEIKDMIVEYDSLTTDIFNESVWVNGSVDPGLAEIVKGMLESDQTKRLTATQVREHPWMKMMEEKYGK